MNDETRRELVRIWAEIKSKENDGKPFKVDILPPLKCMTSKILTNLPLLVS